MYSPLISICALLILHIPDLSPERSTSEEDKKGDDGEEDG